MCVCVYIGGTKQDAVHNYMTTDEEEEDMEEREGKEKQGEQEEAITGQKLQAAEATEVGSGSISLLNNKPGKTSMLMFFLLLILLLSCCGCC